MKELLLILVHGRWLTVEAIEFYLMLMLASSLIYSTRAAAPSLAHASIHMPSTSCMLSQARSSSTQHHEHDHTQIAHTIEAHYRTSTCLHLLRL